MTASPAVIFEEEFAIPAGVSDLDHFRRWSWDETFPERGRIDYLAGTVEVDLSPEDLYTHGVVKTTLTARLYPLIVDSGRGTLFSDRTRIVSPVAGLSVEPDVVAVLWDSLRQGRIREIPAAKAEEGRFIELEGSPDLIVEIVSDSSKRKDLVRLPRLYAAAGVPELWLADCRGDDLIFEIHTLGVTGYEPQPADAESWRRSPLLGRPLFLGDIEQPQQKALVEHEQASKLFADVRAVTLPHHGRPTTLWEDFLPRLRERVGEGAVLLHSDGNPLDPGVEKQATEAGFKILSTANQEAARQDIAVNLFDSTTHHTVTSSKGETIKHFIVSNKGSFPGVANGDVSVDEMTNAVSTYSGRKVTALLRTGTTISLPTEAWVRSHVEDQRKVFVAETDALIEQLRSENEKVVAEAATKLSSRASGLTQAQMDQIIEIMREDTQYWETDLGHPVDCPHKTMYDVRSTKHYAARVVLHSDSNTKSDVRKEAQVAYQEGKAKEIRNDPGWI